MNRRSWRLRGLLLVFVAIGWPVHVIAPARGDDSDLEQIKSQMQQLIRQNAEQQRLIEQLQLKLDAIEARRPGAAAPAPEEMAADSAAVPTPLDPAGALDAAIGALDEGEADSRSDADIALDRAMDALDASTGDAQPVVSQRRLGGAALPGLASRRVGGADVRLIDVSMDMLVAAGSSTASTSEVELLQGGAHDPKRRGFTLQQAELSFTGAVDPYLTAEAHIVFFPEGVELEEAFFTTQALPYGMQLEAGHFLTEFGLINPVHPHAWEWVDQPVINSRVFGPDGTRSQGFRLGWLMPVPFFSEVHVGMQNADASGFAPSFVNSQSVGGRPSLDRSVRSLEDFMYLTRWNVSTDLTPNLVGQIGVSGLFGPNATGRDGQTLIYGADLKLLWRAANNFRGFPFLLFQAEVTKRDYTADWFIAGAEMVASPNGGGTCHGGHCHGDGDGEEGEAPEFPNNLPGGILRDAGFYMQGLYGFRWGWATGLRYEYVGGRGRSVLGGVQVSRQLDPFRDDRHRLSPLLTWKPTEFSRIRLQYNYDNARHLAGREAHSFWLGGEVLYGVHPAHQF